MSRLRIIAVAALLAFSGLPNAAMAQGCASREEARQLLDQGQVIPLPEATSRAGIEDNDVVDAQLCQAGGGYVYRVRLRDGGQASIPAN